MKPIPTLLIALLPTAAFAAGVRIGFKDTAAMARGNAFAATADTPAAVYYNPAGITQIDGQAMSGTAYAIQLQGEFSGASGNATLHRSPKVVPQLYYVWSPEDKPYAFGLGAYAPFGLASSWPGTGPFNLVATDSKLETLSVALVGAIELLPGLSVAAGPTYQESEATLRRNTAFGPYDFHGDGDSLGFNAGILWQPSVRHSFGLSYQHHYDVKHTGVASIAGAVPAQRATLDLAYPEIIILGYSFRPAPGWNLEINLDWTNWNRTNELAINSAPPLGATSALDWQSGFFYDFGVTREFDNGFSLSAGYTFSENSIPDSTYNPAIPDADRHIFALGCGYHTATLSLNLAYHYAHSPDRTVTGSPAGPLTDGTYQNSFHALAASLDYRF